MGKSPWLQKAFLLRPEQMGNDSAQFPILLLGSKYLIYWMYFHLLMSSLGTSLVSLPAFLGTVLPLASVCPSSNPIVKQFIRIWAQYRKRLNLFLYCIWVYAVGSQQHLTLLQGLIVLLGLCWYQLCFQKGMKKNVTFGGNYTSVNSWLSTKAFEGWKILRGHM